MWTSADILHMDLHVYSPCVIFHCNKQTQNLPADEAHNTPSRSCGKMQYCNTTLCIQAVWETSSSHRLDETNHHGKQRTAKYHTKYYIELIKSNTRGLVDGTEVHNLIQWRHCAPGQSYVRGVGLLCHEEMCKQDESTELRKYLVEVQSGPLCQ